MIAKCNAEKEKLFGALAAGKQLSAELTSAAAASDTPLLPHATASADHTACIVRDLTPVFCGLQRKTSMRRIIAAPRQPKAPLLGVRASSPASRTSSPQTRPTLPRCLPSRSSAS